MLVVDDSEAIRTAVWLLFEAQAVVEVVGVATDGREAIDKAEALRPDLVLTDFQMPGMDGLELTRLLLVRFPTIRVVVMSLHDEALIRAACETSGAHGFVSKVNLDSELPRKIAELFGFPL